MTQQYSYQFTTKYVASIDGSAVVARYHVCANNPTLNCYVYDSEGVMPLCFIHMMNRDQAIN